MGHTPGPWKAVTVPTSIAGISLLEISILNNRGNLIVSNVMTYNPDWHKRREVEANADLIAAAPELLEALERANKFITNGIEFGYIRLPDADCPDPAHETPGIIRAAIAKAKGGQL